MKHWLIDVAAGISLLAGLAAVVLWGIFGMMADTRWMQPLDWLAMFAFIAWPILWFALRTEPEPRPYDRYCQTCGYDLRATPDRCPECGSIPPWIDVDSNS